MVGIVSYNPLYLLGFLVFGVVGFGYVASALSVGRGSGFFRDRVIVGMCLLGTAFVFFLLLVGSYSGGDLFSDAASSVSGAPGP